MNFLTQSLMFLLVLSGPLAHADTGEVQDTSTEDTAAGTPAAEAPKTPKPADRPKPPPPPTFVEENQSELLALAGLFFLWLLARLLAPTPDARPSPRQKRVSPVNAQELGRILYSIGRGDDFVAYRNLYLTGSEATGLLGEAKSIAYLEKRTADVLKLAYEHLRTQIPSGSRYTSTLLDEQDRLSLLINNEEGKVQRIAVARIARVGAIMRLASPIVKAAENVADDVEDENTE